MNVPNPISGTASSSGRARTVVGAVFVAFALAAGLVATSDGLSAVAARLSQDPSADLEVEALTISRPSAAPGEAVVYRVVVRNGGPDRAEGVAVDVPVPAGLLLAAHDGGSDYDPPSGRWSIGGLDADDRRRLTITTTLEAPPMGPLPSGTAKGTFVAEGSGGLGGPVDLLFDADGTLLVTSSGTDEVLRYGTDGSPAGAFVAAGAGGLDGPDGISFGAGGQLYVASAENDAVLRYDGTSGTFLDTLVPPGSGGLTSPADILFDSAGDLLVAQAGDPGAVLRFAAADGTPLGAAVTPGVEGLARPFGLALMGSTDLLVADESGDAVRRFSLETGMQQPDFVVPRAGGLVGPDRIVFGPDGGLYVSNAGGSNVLRYDGASGTFDRVFSGGVDDAIDLPSGLAFGPDGDLFVSSFGTDSVERFAGFVMTRAAIAVSSLSDPDPTNDERSAALTVKPGVSASPADLRVSMALTGEVDDIDAPDGIAESGERVTAGRMVEADVRVANAGPGGAADTAVGITMPEGFELVSWDVREMGTEVCLSAMEDGHTLLVCELGDLVVGSETRISFEGRAAPSVESGELLRFEADAATDSPEARSEDDSASGELIVERRADLATSIMLEPEAPAGLTTLGAFVTATVRVENLGPSVAARVATSVTLPAGLTRPLAFAERWFCDRPANGALRCESTNLLPDEVAEITLWSLLADAAPGASPSFDALSNGVPGEDLHPDNDRSTAKITVDAEPTAENDVSVALHVPDRPNPDPTGRVRFRIELRNDGPTTASGVRLVHRLPPGLRYGGDVVGPGDFDSEIYSGRWLPGPIPAGESVELDVGARFDDAVEPTWPEGSGRLLGELGDGAPRGAPGKLALGPDGDIYVADGGGAVRRFDGVNGAERDPFVPSGGTLRFASALAFGPDGDLYVADAVNDAIRRYDGATGAEKDLFVTPGSGGLATPSDLAWGPDGQLYVADQLGSRVLRFDGGDGCIRRCRSSGGTWRSFDPIRDRVRASGRSMGRQLRHR